MDLKGSFPSLFQGYISVLAVGGSGFHTQKVVRAVLLQKQ
jgi:hypothetical protein